MSFDDDQKLMRASKLSSEVIGYAAELEGEVETHKSDLRDVGKTNKNLQDEVAFLKQQLKEAAENDERTRRRLANIAAGKDPDYTEPTKYSPPVTPVPPKTWKTATAKDWLKLGGLVASAIAIGVFGSK